jgi:hypothetical protein
VLRCLLCASGAACTPWVAVFERRRSCSGPLAPHLLGMHQLRDAIAVLLKQRPHEQGLAFQGAPRGARVPSDLMCARRPHPCVYRSL